jgi:hypothetical protein
LKNIIWFKEHPNLFLNNFNLMLAFIYKHMQLSTIQAFAISGFINNGSIEECKWMAIKD